MKHTFHETEVKSIKKVEINTIEQIKKVLPDTLIKDLQENERICPVCNGLGMAVSNNIYGIKGDTSEIAKRIRFPYNHQSIQFCPNCYNGVITVCKYCGKQIQKGYIDKCDCEEYLSKEKEKQKIERKKKQQERINKAKEVKLGDLGTDTYFYDEYKDDYFSDIDYFIDSYVGYNEYKTEDEMLKSLPDVLWLCESKIISINADSIIENACEELHEDAYENVTKKDTDELQKLLDEWCAKQTGTTTLYPDYTRYVKVRKKWFKRC